MIRLQGLDLLLTYRCSGRCAHCCYRAGPRRGETMTLAEVETYLAAVPDPPPQSILLFGGEPFLVPELLKAAVARVSSMARALVFTNGSWAEDLETARRRLSELQAAGLDYVLFSVDAFHQARVPLERVAAGIRAARELGFSTVAIDNRLPGDRAGENAFDRHTRTGMARLADLCELDGVEISRGPARMVGRAADQLAPFLPTQTAPPRRCPLPDYLGGDLRAPTGVEIHPGGWVNLCAGINLGNALERPLDRILGTYDPDAHPIVRLLAAEGPAGLLRLARQRGFSLPGGFVSACHLCYQARRFLQPHFPAHLAPAYVYVEAPAASVLRLEEDITYGPVDSRRLGRSLGVNLLPADRKVCSFDCVYCQYGRTDVKTLTPQAALFPSVERVLAEVERALHAHPGLDYLTFSGNGEPTLHPDFPRIVAGVRHLRDELRPQLKLALLSNATTAHRTQVRQALALLDAPILKLDAGDPETLAAINRPAPGVTLPQLVGALRGIPNLVVQSVLTDGAVSNARGQALEAWLSALSQIEPAGVQVYSTDRPVGEAGVARVPPERLRRIAASVEQRAGCPARAYWS